MKENGEKMILCRVIGPVVSTQKHITLYAKTLLAVQPIDQDGKEIGSAIIAIDTVSAGPGDKVLVLKEGSGSAQILNLTKPPINTIIVGIVDQ